MPSSSGLKTEAAGSSTVLLNIHQTAPCHVPEACDLNIHHCGNLKCHIFLLFVFLCKNHFV